MESIHHCYPTFSLLDSKLATKVAYQVDIVADFIIDPLISL
jgi:hypothetical protein